MNTIESIKALENGKGIQHLLDSAYKIFNNPLYMIDSSYNFIAASHGPMEIAAWSDLVTTGTYSLEVKEYLAQANLYYAVTNTHDVIAKSKNALYVPKDDIKRYSSVTEHIFNRDSEAIGSLVMYEYYSSLGDDSLPAFEVLVEKIEHEIQDYEYFIRLPTINFEVMVHTLLDRTAKPTIVHQSQASMARMHYDKYLYVVAVYTPQRNMQDKVHRSRLEYLRSLLKRKYPKPLIYAIYTDHIVMMRGSEFETFDKAMPLGDDYEFFTNNDLYVGVSKSFVDVFEFGVNYDEAIAALRKGVEASNGKRVFITK